MSVTETWAPKWKTREQALRDQLGGGDLPAEFVQARQGPAGRSRAMPPGGGILLAAILGLLLWLLIVLAAVSVVSAL